MHDAKDDKNLLKIDGMVLQLILPLSFIIVLI